MDLFTIQSSGNGLNFGDLTELTNYGLSTASRVRGVFSGGCQILSDLLRNTISFVTISTTGNAVELLGFGLTVDQVVEAYQILQEVLLVVDNNTELDFITIASLGDSQDFGTLDRECKI